MSEISHLPVSWRKPFSYRNQTGFYMIAASVMKELKSSFNGNCLLCVAFLSCVVD